MTSTMRVAARSALTVGRVVLWTLLAVYSAVVIMLNIGAVNWETRAIITVIALIPLSIVSGIVGVYQLVRRRHELTFERRTSQAAVFWMIPLGVAAATAFLIGYLLA